MEEKVVPKRKTKPRSFWEPWTASKSVSHGKTPDVTGLPPDAAAVILEAWGRIEENARWVIWGSGMADPGIARALISGELSVMDDRRIILPVDRLLGLPDGSPDQEDLSRRIVECVNSMQGVGDPVRFVDDVRAFLLSLARNDDADERTDIRAASLLGRCIPPGELESNEHVKEES